MFIHLQCHNRCLERIRKAKHRFHILKRQLLRRKVVFAASFLLCIPCVRLVSLQSDKFGLFRHRKRPNIIYIYIKYKKHFKMNKEIEMLLPKKRVNTSGVGESNNYYEDIYNTYTF